MKLKSALAIFLCTISVAGCATEKGSTETVQRVSDERQRIKEITRGLPSAYALPGTTTAVVGIGIDKKGVPLETVKEIVLKPGQKVIFAGPDRFEIKFKKDRAPSQQLFFESKSGAITVEVPRDILDRPEYAREYKENKYIRFDYSIFVNGKELDPPLIIRRDD